MYVFKIKAKVHTRYLLFYLVIDCGMPELYEYTHVHFNNTTYGSTAQYECEVGYWFENGTQFANTSCEANGTWTSVPQHCEGRNAHTQVLCN